MPVVCCTVVAAASVSASMGRISPSPCGPGQPHLPHPSLRRRFTRPASAASRPSRIVDACHAPIFIPVLSAIAPPQKCSHHVLRVKAVDPRCWPEATTLSKKPPLNFSRWRTLVLACFLMLSVALPDAAKAERDIPARATGRDWQVRIDDIQKAFLNNPASDRFLKAPDRALGTAPFQGPSQPVTKVHAPPEWSRQVGIITDWWCDPSGEADAWDRMWMAIIAETFHSGATPYVYLSSANGLPGHNVYQACATRLKNHEGVDPGDVVWMLDRPGDAFWVRDFGPLFRVYDAPQTLAADIPGARDLDVSFSAPLTAPSGAAQGVDMGDWMSIQDPLYYAHRPRDDRQPRSFARRIQARVEELELAFEGGNFLANGHGVCVVSDIVLGANPQYTRKDIANLFRNRFGCTQFAMVRALDDHATGHVDIWMSWANADTLLVGRYTEDQDPTNHAIIEGNIKEHLSGLKGPTGTPINIQRVPMPSNCPTASRSADAPLRCPGSQHLNGFGGHTSTCCRSTAPSWSRLSGPIVGSRKRPSKSGQTSVTGFAGSRQTTSWVTKAPSTA